MLVTDNVIIGEVLQRNLSSSFVLLFPLLASKRMVVPAYGMDNYTLTRWLASENIEDIYTWPDYQAYEDEAIGFGIQSIEEVAL